MQPLSKSSSNSRPRSGSRPSEKLVYQRGPGCHALTEQGEWIRDARPQNKGFGDGSSIALFVFDMAQQMTLAEGGAERRARKTLQRRYATSQRLQLHELHRLFLGEAPIRVDR